MTFQWPKEAYGNLPNGVQLARKILQEWFQAIEDGSVKNKLPDPLYSVDFKEGQVDAIIRDLDAEFERELRSWAYQETAGSYTHGPGFSRLEPPQRLALAQALHYALRVQSRDVSPPTFWL